MRTLLALFILSGPAFCEGWNLREGEHPLSPADIEHRIIGRTLTFFDNGEAKFSAGGAYSYGYHNGATSFGSFQLTDDGVICIAFHNGWTRCDKYVWSGTRLVMVTQKGDRFPVRP